MRTWRNWSSYCRWGVCSCSVGKSSLTLCDPMDCSTPGFPVLHYLWVCSNSCPLKSVMPFNHLILCHPFSSCPQTFPASGSFQMRHFSSGGQSIGVSTSTSVLPMSIQDWFPLELADLILQSKGLSRVFSNTTVEKHQFFSTQLSFWSNSHIHTWLLETP